MSITFEKELGVKKGKRREGEAEYHIPGTVH